MKIIANLLLTISLLFVSACGGHAVIKLSSKKATYDQKVFDLLIVIDESHLQRALLQNKKDVSFNPHIDVNVANSAEERMAARNARVADQLAAQKKLTDWLSAPTLALKKSLISAFSTMGVSAQVEIVNVGRDRLALSNVAKRRDQQQILFLNTSSFQTTQSTWYGKPYGPIQWTGRISWDVKLIDRGTPANSDDKSVWNAKTDFFLFGPAECSSDAFKSCSDRFVTTLIKQMEMEGLFAANK